LEQILIIFHIGVSEEVGAGWSLTLAYELHRSADQRVFVAFGAFAEVRLEGLVGILDWIEVSDRFSVSGVPAHIALAEKLVNSCGSDSAGASAYVEHR
jgi:hypothetical protein